MLRCKVDAMHQCQYMSLLPVLIYECRRLFEGSNDALESSISTPFDILVGQKN
jgi:hypothetical protein